MLIFTNTVGILGDTTIITYFEHTMKALCQFVSKCCCFASAVWRRSKFIPVAPLFYWTSVEMDRFSFGLFYFSQIELNISLSQTTKTKEIILITLSGPEAIQFSKNVFKYCNKVEKNKQKTIAQYKSNMVEILF